MHIITIVPQISMPILEIQFHLKMFFEESCSSSLEEASTQNLKAMMQGLKVPYLRKVQQAKSRFYDHANKFKQEKQHQITQQCSTQRSPPLTEQATKNSERNLKLKMKNKKNKTQSSCEQQENGAKGPYFGEWVMAKQKNSAFKALGEMVQHYNNTFQKKVKFAKAKKRFGESFILQQKLVIERIYEEISDSSGQSVEFQSVLTFFEQCPLFYTIYNIHPCSLSKTLKDSAHKYGSKLTKNEFINLFLINNRSNKDFQRFNVGKSQRTCVLGQEKWQEIKQIAILFDTFGNETIQLKQFLKKIKIGVQYKYLLDLDVLSFGNINRTYTLAKILSEVENKLNLGQSFMKWEQIKDLIMNFQHVQEPTIDVLEKEKIRAGEITNFSNTFMVKEEVLDFVKQTFYRCPKYCENFVKMSEFCGEVHEGEKSKVYLSEIVRTYPQIVNVKQVLNSFRKDNRQYLDLDQILEQFSLKAPNKAGKTHLKQSINSDQSQSLDQQFQRKVKEKQLSKKESSKQLKKSNAKPTQRKDVTVADQFKLSRKNKHCIRDQKVKQMLEEKALKEIQECSKKIKANPIPASINPKNYQEYKKKMDENKQSIKKQLSKVSQKDAFLLKYLEANTKLFQKPKALQSTPTNYTFQPKPIPWFVHVNLLDKINEQKQNKMREIKKQTKIKYLNDWKNLPFCAQSAPTSLDNLPQSTHQCEKHNQQDFLSQIAQPQSNIRKKSKVKAVPNFQQLQKQFQQSLQKKKMGIKATEIVQFNLTSPKNRQKDIQTSAISCRPMSQPKLKTIQSNNYFIGSTLKYQSMVKSNQDKKLLQQFHKQEEHQEEKRRERGRKMFARIMRNQLKKQLKSPRSMNGKPRVASSNWHNEKQLAEMYKRVFSRPFLFQNSPKNVFNQQNASRVKLGNQKSLADKFIDQVQPQEINYTNEDHQADLVSHQSI